MHNKIKTIIDWPHRISRSDISLDGTGDRLEETPETVNSGFLIIKQDTKLENNEKIKWN
jgi:hypothetical protein